MNAFIRKIDSMIQLPAEKRLVLTELAERVQLVVPRKRMIETGEQSNIVNIVLKGWACRYQLLADGRRQIISFILPGDMCNPNVFSRQTGVQVIDALTPVTLAEVSADTIRRLMASDLKIAEVLWIQMLEASEIQREWLVSLGRRKALERVAHLCCEISTRLEAVGETNGLDCEMPLSQVEVADAIGLSPAHVNRSLQDLRATGLIALRSKRLTIVDRQALQSLAMFDPAYLHRRAR